MTMRKHERGRDMPPGDSVDGRDLPDAGSGTGRTGDKDFLDDRKMRRGYTRRPMDGLPTSPFGFEGTFDD